MQNILFPIVAITFVFVLVERGGLLKQLELGPDGEVIGVRQHIVVYSQHILLVCLLLAWDEDSLVYLPIQDQEVHERVQQIDQVHVRIFEAKLLEEHVPGREQSLRCGEVLLNVGVLIDFLQMVHERILYDQGVVDPAVGRLHEIEQDPSIFEVAWVVLLELLHHLQRFSRITIIFVSLQKLLHKQVYRRLAHYINRLHQLAYPLFHPPHLDEGDAQIDVVVDDLRVVVHGLLIVPVGLIVVFDHEEAGGHDVKDLGNHARIGVLRRAELEGNFQVFTRLEHASEFLEVHGINGSSPSQLYLTPYSPTNSSVIK